MIQRPEQPRHTRQQQRRLTGRMRAPGAIAALCCALQLISAPAGAAPTGGTGGAPKIAVFHFELEDLSPAEVLTHRSTTTAAALDRVSVAARAELAASGRYRVVDADRIPLPREDPDSRGCAPCGAAAPLGVDQIMTGVVRRVTQTDYYLIVQIRDAHTGKVLDEQAANFAGDQAGWASGARMLIRHQVLVASGDAAQCRQALVNPVSGFAECVDPRGAPVAAPPPRPN